MDKLEIIAVIKYNFLNMIQRQVCELQGVSTNFWITPRMYMYIGNMVHICNFDPFIADRDQSSIILYTAWNQVRSRVTRASHSSNSQ